MASLGWQFLRHGGNHDVWAHPVHTHHLAVPRHTEIGENTARTILRMARGK